MDALSEDLKRWFKEKWVDISRKDKSGKHPPCGRKKSSKKNYPKCRPSVRVSSETPETSGEMSGEEKKKAVRQKRSAESKKKRKGKKPIMTSHHKIKEYFDPVDRIKLVEFVTMELKINFLLENDSTQPTAPTIPARPTREPDEKLSTLDVVRQRYPGHSDEEYRTAIERQVDAYNKMGDEAKALVRLRFGDPTQATYWYGKMPIFKIPKDEQYSNFDTRWEGGRPAGMLDANKTWDNFRDDQILINTNTGTPESWLETQDHEMKHWHQFANVAKRRDGTHHTDDLDRLVLDQGKEYREQDRERGAEIGAQAIRVRQNAGHLGPIEDMADRARERVNTQLWSPVPQNPNTAIESEVDEYLKSFIAKGNKSKLPGQDGGSAMA